MQKSEQQIGWEQLRGPSSAVRPDEFIICIYTFSVNDSDLVQDVAAIILIIKYPALWHG